MNKRVKTSPRARRTKAPSPASPLPGKFTRRYGCRFMALVMQSASWVNWYTMHRIRVESSSIARIGYDERSKMLEVVFSDGAIYRYFGVPKTVADAFMYDPPGGSHGKYFLAHIRGIYRYINYHGPGT